MWTHGQYSDSSRYIPLDAPGVYRSAMPAESLYIVWYKNIALFSSLSGPERAASPASFLLFSSARRPRACDHHYARPPSLVPVSPSRSPSRPPPQPPSFVLLTSHPTARISSASNYVSAKRVETKALLTSDRLINCNVRFGAVLSHECFRISIFFSEINLPRCERRYRVMTIGPCSAWKIVSTKDTRHRKN